MKRLFALLLLAAFATVALTGCNTIAGMGKDVQKVGEKVEEKAQDCRTRSADPARAAIRLKRRARATWPVSLWGRADAAHQRLGGSATNPCGNAVGEVRAYGSSGRGSTPMATSESNSS